MSKLEEYTSVEDLNELRSSYTKNQFGNKEHEYLNFYDVINEFLDEKREKYPDLKMVGVQDCRISFKLCGEVPKVYMYLGVKVRYEPDGEEKLVDTSVTFNLDYISDVIEDMGEYFNGQEEKETKA